MGKQGKKKQRQKRQQQHDRQHTNPASEDSTTTSTINPSSAVHQLRHPDPKIRQNALVALQATVLQQDSSNSNKRVSVAVLQAVREQVMDTNLECASAAAECLAQYLSQAKNMEFQAVTTASWTPVLMVRLDQCLKALQNKSGDSKIKLWYALAAPCTRALCKLVELNERALEHIMNATTQMDFFLVTILGLLQVVTTVEGSTTDLRMKERVEATATFAARTLHSALDENLDLVQRIHATHTQETQTAWSQLLVALPDLSKLHVCGSLVTMHQTVPAPWQSTLLIEHVLPCLTSSLLVVQPEQLQSLEQDYVQAVALRKTQLADEELEGEIVRKIDDKKEPARLIARRQKDVDRGSKAVIVEEDTKDGEQAVEDALVAWNGIILPLQVCLEVTANLLSCFIHDDNAMDDHTPVHDTNLHQALISARLAESLLKTLQTLGAYQSSRGDMSPEQDGLTDDLQECIGKCAACITNCVLSQVLEPGNFEATWQVLLPLIHGKGVSSILVVLTQQNFVIPAKDTLVIKHLLNSTMEDSQRDGVCLLTTILNNPQCTMQVVMEATQELLQVLQRGEKLARIEALNSIMDLWGQDEFHPHVFTSQQILPNFQAALASLSTDKSLDPEAEEVLFNAGRFVDYKLGR